MQRASNHFRLPGQAVIASLLVALVLLLEAMAACPGLHELIHKDAKSAEHECSITLFAHGQVDSAVVDISVAAPTVFIETTPVFTFSVFAPFIENLPAGRGPPASVAFLA